MSTGPREAGTHPTHTSNAPPIRALERPLAAPYVTDDSILIDVLIVAYNSATDIVECLTSIMAQSHVRFRFFVYDNSRTEDTMVSAKHVLTSMAVPCEVWRDHSNPGYARGVNFLLTRSTAAYVLVLNPDTSFRDSDPDTLIHLLGHCRSSGRTGFVTCRLHQANGAIDHACKRGEPTLLASICYLTRLRRFPIFRAIARRYTAGHVAPGDVAGIDAINGAFMLASRRTIDAIGPLDERFWMYGEDLDWCRRSRELGYKNIYDGRFTVIHRKMGSEPAGRSKATTRAFYRSMWIYFLKHHKRRHRLLKPLVYVALRVLEITAVRSAAPQRGALHVR